MVVNFWFYFIFFFLILSFLLSLLLQFVHLYAQYKYDKWTLNVSLWVFAYWTYSFIHSFAMRSLFERRKKSNNEKQRKKKSFRNALPWVTGNIDNEMSLGPNILQKFVTFRMNNFMLNETNGGEKKKKQNKCKPEWHALGNSLCLRHKNWEK